jgi:hypothetical protein
VKIGVSTKRMIDYTPMADNRQAGTARVREVQQLAAILLWPDCGQPACTTMQKLA